MDTTKLLGTLLHQHGCVQHWLSQQLATTPNMLAWNLVTPNMVAWNLVTPNMVAWNLVTRNMVAWNLVTPNMVGRNLDILEHGYYEVTWNPPC